MSCDGARSCAFESLCAKRLAGHHDGRYDPGELVGQSDGQVSRASPHEIGAPDVVRLRDVQIAREKIARKIKEKSCGRGIAGHDPFRTAMAPAWFGFGPPHLRHKARAGKRPSGDQRVAVPHQGGTVVS